MFKEETEMSYIICYIVGLFIGILGTIICIYVKCGVGGFKLEKIKDEEDFYTINVRLVPDQKLNKKKYILLTRE